MSDTGTGIEQEQVALAHTTAIQFCVARFIWVGAIHPCVARQMTTDELTTQVEAAQDPAKELGSVETWNGTDVHVLRNANGHFVTWRKVSPAEAASAPVAVADGGRDELSFETDSGADVIVWAESGTIYATFGAGDLSAEGTRASLTTKRGIECLDCGTHRDDSGEKHRVHIPTDGHREEIEELREDSKSDEPLRYEVVEHTETSRAGGWGEREITTQKLSANKSVAEMTEREQTLSHKVDTDRAPEDTEVGDVLALDDLLDDARTADEKDQDALDEAAETGEEVVISKTTTDCNDSSEECNLDHVTRVATPEGDVETRRTHTY